MKGITVEFGADTIQFDNSVRGINSALGVLRRDIMRLNRDMRFDGVNVEGLNEKLRQTEEALKLNKDKAESLRKQLSETSDPKMQERLSRELQVTENNIKNLERSAASTQAQLDRMNDPSSAYNLNKAFEDVSYELETVNKLLELDPSNVDLVARQSELMGQQMDIASQRTESLQKELNDLKAKNAPDEDIRRVERALADSATEANNLKNNISGVGDSAKDAATKSEGLSDGIKGMVTGAAMELTRRGIDMVKDSLDDAIKRVDTLNNFPRTMGNLGIDAEDSKKAIDRLSDGLSGLPTTLNDAASGVQRFTAKNGDVEKSTEIFLAMNNAIIAGGAESQNQAAAVEQLTQAYSKGSIDMNEWRSLQVAMPAQLNQISAAFGMTQDEFYEALKSGDVSMDDFMQKLVDLNSEGSGELGSFEDQARAACEGIGTSSENMHTAVTRGVAGIIDEIGQDAISEAIGKITDAINSVAEVAKDVITFVKDNGDVFGPFAIILGTVAGAVAACTLAVAAFNAVLALNPLVWVAIAIGAVILLLIYFFKRTELGKKIFETLSEFCTKAFDGIKNAIGKVVDWVKSNWPLLLGILLGPIGIAAALIFKNWDKIKGFFKDGIAKCVEAVTGVKEKVANFFSGIPDAVWAKLKAITTFGKDIVRGLADGLSPTAVISKIKEICNKSLDAIKKFFKISSPSRLMEEIGTYVMSGFAAGITNAGRYPVAAMYATVEGVAAQAERISGVVDGIGKAMDAQASKWSKSYEKQLKGSSDKLTKSQQNQLKKFSGTLSKQIEINKNQLKSVVESLKDNIADASAKLEEAKKAFADYSDGIKNTFKGFGSLGSLELGEDASDYVKSLQNRLKATSEFSKNILALRSKGLNKDAIDEILAAGLDKGAAMAEMLANGSAEQIKQINNVQAQITSIGAQLGDKLANSYFKAGIDSAQALVNGLASQAAQVEAAATKLGKNIAKIIAAQLKKSSNIKIKANGVVVTGGSAPKVKQKIAGLIAASPTFSGTGATNNYHINVTANNADAEAIASIVERKIVRGVTR
ncbi:MAG: tape measure protein [Coriobacteriia bacterium]|nr:tape measure protein [Coriobacteriia bacterium]